MFRNRSPSRGLVAHLWHIVCRTCHMSATASRLSPKSPAYTSSVIAAEAWPNIRWTALTLVPAAIASDAAVWRRSCGVRSRSPAASRAGSKTRVRQFRSRNSPPSGALKIGSSGSRPSASSAIRVASEGVAGPLSRRDHRGESLDQVAPVMQLGQVSPWQLARRASAGH